MDSLATRDPIEIIASYFASEEGEKHPADVRARTVITALDEAGFAVVPKLVPRKRDCLDELHAISYARLVEQLGVKP